MGLDMYLVARKRLTDDRAKDLEGLLVAGGAQFTPEDDGDPPSAWVSVWDYNAKPKCMTPLAKQVLSFVGLEDLFNERNGIVLDVVKHDESLVVKAEVAYWRKANAIHAWFVREVQSGEDDCGYHDVSIEQLQALVEACKQLLDSVETVDGEIHVCTTYYPGGKVVERTEPGQVVAQAGLAAKVLPTQPGFFFGSTEYDQYYLGVLRNTVEQIERVLASESDGLTFAYHSSW